MSLYKWLAIGIAVAVLTLGLVVIVAGVGGSSGASASTCAPAGSTLATPTTATGLDQEQLTNAGLIISIGNQSIGPAGEVVAIAAAMTESGLRNLLGGDRDSAGLFQMRPSQGWGTYLQVTDPNYAIQTFYSRLAAVPGWSTMPPGNAAQAVERSAFPDRYTANVPLAQQLVANAKPGAGTVILVDNCTPAGSVALGPGGAGLPAVVQAQIAAAPLQVQQAINFALAQVGKPYQWGATGPATFDCSGLTQAAWAAAGVSIPRTTFEQVSVGQPVAQADLQPGDLLFPDPGHVQLYLGGGLVVEAQRTGTNILVDQMWGFWTARQVI